MNRFFLLPGKISCASEATEIATNLGSCVAVCLFDSRKGIGGMNHYLLPAPLDGQAPSARFAVYAIKTLVNQMVELGASPKSLQAKIFGGGNLFPDMAVGRNVGAMNISIAKEILGEMKIPIVESNVGGNEARRITFRTDTFAVECISEKSSAKENFDITGYRSAQEPTKVTVAIVDDHPAIQKLYENIFKKHGLEVVGTAGDAFEARKLIVEKKPMVVTLDIEMPNMSGVEFLEKLMKHYPLPVVMVSHLDSQGEQAHRALELGAVEFVQKPLDVSSKALREMAELLVEKVRAAASKGAVAQRQLATKSTPPPVLTPHFGRNLSQKAELILIAGNTGSPPTLKTLLRSLPSNLPPVVVANSTLSHFLPSFVQNLQGETRLKLQIAASQQKLQPGHVYFIPNGTDGEVVQRKNDIELHLNSARSALQSPSADALFESGAACKQLNVVGLLLSGYGTDGVAGLEKMAGAKHVVMVQSPHEAALGFTALKAIALGVVDYVVSTEELIELLGSHSRRKAA